MRAARRGCRERKQAVKGRRRPSGYCLCREVKGEGSGASEPPEIRKESLTIIVIEEGHRTAQGGGALLLRGQGLDVGEEKMGRVRGRSKPSVHYSTFCNPCRIFHGQMNDV